MKVVVSGGGTGGHIYPALALIRTIKSLRPDTEFLYIGTEKGLEKTLVERENIPFASIYITGFKRSISLENVKTVLRFIKGTKRSKQLLKNFGADVVIGTGGYVCGPVVYAASKMNIPTIIHEQNSVPGLTNKFLSKYVDRVAICFDEAAPFFPEEKVAFTGNPRASEVLGMKDYHVLQPLNLNKDKKTVLIFGGSRGARPINDAVTAAFQTFSNKSYQLLYVTGDVHYEKVKAQLNELSLPDNISVVPFIYNMPEILRVVDLVVARAGATSLAELTALGLPSILIPSPYVTNNHQVKNAQSLVSKGAALMLEEPELNEVSLIENIDRILLSEEMKETMSQASHEMGVRDASQRVYKIMETLVSNNK